MLLGALWRREKEAYKWPCVCWETGSWAVLSLWVFPQSAWMQQVCGTDIDTGFDRLHVLVFTYKMFSVFLLVFSKIRYSINKELRPAKLSDLKVILIHIDTSLLGIIRKGGAILTHLWPLTFFTFVPWWHFVPIRAKVFHVKFAIVWKH